MKGPRSHEYSQDRIGVPEIMTMVVLLVMRLGIEFKDKIDKTILEILREGRIAAVEYIEDKKDKLAGLLSPPKAAEPERQIAPNLISLYTPDHEKDSSIGNTAQWEPPPWELSGSDAPTR